MTIAAILALALPVATVWIWLDVLRLRAAAPSAAVSAAVSFALGIGFSSLVATWLVLAGVPVSPRFAAIDAAVWLALGLLGWWLRASRARPSSPSATTSMRSRQAAAPTRALTAIDWIARAGFAVVAVLALAMALGEYHASPHGQWDAWAIWNQKARFLVRGGATWTDLLLVEWAQPGHPLLVPMSVARLWAYAGREFTAAPALFAGLVGVSIVLAVMGALDLRRPRAWVAGAVLVAPATFVTQVMSQQADVPVALFLTLTVVLLRTERWAEWQAPGRARASLLLAGAAAGLAAWTKNEGLLFVGLATVVTVWIAARHAGIRQLAWWCVGLAPAMVTVAGFKRLASSAPIYFSENQTVQASLQRLLSPDIHALIAGTIGARWYDWGGVLASGALPLVIVCAVATAVGASGQGARVALVCAVSMLAAFYLVWVVSPLDTAWLVNTTFERLVAQVWPLFVLAAFSKSGRTIA